MRRTTMLGVSLAALLAFGAPGAHATNIDEVWNFGNPAESSVGHNNDLNGTTETVTALPVNVGVPSIGVTAFATNTGTGNHDLYLKTGSGDETGLGLNNDPTLDHEISATKQGNHYNSNGFIQLDISGLTVPPLVNFALSFQMDSTTSPDVWGVCLTDTAGQDTSCGQTHTGSDESLTSFSIQEDVTGHPYHYLDVYAVSGNVLLTEVDATVNVDPVPEPTSLAILGVGLLGLTCLRRRRI
jgi:hypothetical protein